MDNTLGPSFFNSKKIPYYNFLQFNSKVFKFDTDSSSDSYYCCERMGFAMVDTARVEQVFNTNYATKDKSVARQYAILANVVDRKSYDFKKYPASTKNDKLFQ